MAGPEGQAKPHSRSMLEFCRRLPKMELHAHLNGSLRGSTVRELAEIKGLASDMGPSAVERLTATGVTRTLAETFALFDLIHKVLSYTHAPAVLICMPFPLACSSLPLLLFRPPNRPCLSCLLTAVRPLLCLLSTVSPLSAYLLPPLTLVRPSLFLQVTTDHETITRITREVLEDLRDDGVIYAELRTTPKADASRGMDKESYMQAVFEGADAFFSSRDARDSHPFVIRQVNHPWIALVL